MLLNLILSFGSYLLFCFLLFRLSKKANLENAWLAFVPIIQVFLYLKLAKVSGWWFLGLFIPFVNLGIMVWVCIKLAHNFGEKKGFGVLFLLPPISFWAMWKLGNNGDIPPLSADDQESIEEIRHALSGGYNANAIKGEALNLGLSKTKVDFLFSLATKKVEQNSKTKTWLIVVLAILEIPLFLGMIFLMAFSSVAPFLYSFMNDDLNSEISITLNNDEDTVVEEMTGSGSIKAATEIQMPDLEYYEGIDFEVSVDGDLSVSEKETSLGELDIAPSDTELTEIKAKETELKPKDKPSSGIKRK